MHTIPYQSQEEIRKSALYLSGFCFLIGSVQMLLDNHLFFYFHLASFLILFIGLFLPGVMRPIITGLQRLGFYLGVINSKIILTACFYLLVTPFGFILRLVNRNPLALKPDNQARSYWIARDVGRFTKQNFESQF